LAFWEEHLAMKIEGVKEDVLRVVFNHINENDWMRECSFTIDLADRDYKGIVRLEKLRSNFQVLDCKPMLPNLSDLVNRLNETREFFDFLKWMRKGFKQQALR